MGFRNITLKEAYEMARNSYEDIWDSADSVGRDVKIYLHWTAGHYHQPYTHYHFNIDVDGTILKTEILTADQTPTPPATPTYDSARLDFLGWQSPYGFT